MNLAKNHHPYIMRSFILTLVSVSIIFLTGCTGKMLNDYRESSSDILILPNDYRVFGSLGELHFIAKKETIIVNSNISDIGWNNLYVLYKRITPPNDFVEIGVINTKDGKITILSADEDINNQLIELGIGKIELKNVDELIEIKRKRK